MNDGWWMAALFVLGFFLGVTGGSYATDSAAARWCDNAGKVELKGQWYECRPANGR